MLLDESSMGTVLSAVLVKASKELELKWNELFLSSRLQLPKLHQRTAFVSWRSSTCLMFFVLIAPLQHMGNSPHPKQRLDIREEHHTCHKLCEHAWKGAAHWMSPGFMTATKTECVLFFVLFLPGWNSECLSWTTDSHHTTFLYLNAWEFLRSVNLCRCCGSIGSHFSCWTIKWSS